MMAEVHRSSCRFPFPASAIAVATMLTACVVGVTAQGETSVWAGIYTKAQAARGELVYQEKCALCHSDDLRGENFAPPLVGEPFDARWRDEILANLITVVKVTMPQERPGSLTDNEYADVVAFILMRNSFPDSAQELSVDPSKNRYITFKKSGGAER